MSLQSFSPKLGLAIAIAIARAKKAKVNSASTSAEEKNRIKQVTKKRNEQRLAENIAQRALNLSRSNR